MDTLIVAMIVVGSCLLLSGTIWLAYLNPGSSSLGLATGTLAAAAVLWTVQALFELRPSIERHYIPIAITINPSELTFAGPHKGRLPVDREQFPDAARYVNENVLAAHLRKLKLSAIATESERAADAYVLYNLVAYMTAANADWQGHRVSYTGATRKEAFIPLSRAGEYTAYSHPQLQDLLESSGNLLAPVRLPTAISDGLRLPPKSVLHLDSKSLTILHPAFTATFTVRMPGEDDPACCMTGTGFERDGVNYLSLWRGLDIEIKYARLRAQPAGKTELAKWLTNMIEGARLWFATTEPQGSIVVIGT